MGVGIVRGFRGFVGNSIWHKVHFFRRPELEDLKKENGILQTLKKLGLD